MEVYGIMDFKEMYRFWCEDDYFDAATKAELLAIRVLF